MPIREYARRFGLIAAGGAVIVGFHVIRLTDSSRFAVCMLRRTTGLPCPTCGMTRAFSALAKGDWRAAVSYHPLSPAFAACLLGIWLYVAWCRLRGRTVPAAHRRIIHWSLAALGLAAVAVWIVRMAILVVAALRGGAS
jgi:hypothetical protein